ncbi:hypothetical protein V6N13_065501 [Hibiscus sabdariffa]
MSGSPTLAHESAMTIEVINPGGRPPDGLPNITGDTIRERATSPFDLDSLRSSKKGCLNSVDLMESNNSTIEANEGIPQVGVEPGVALHGEAVKDSYASKLSGKQSKDGANHCFLKDEEVTGLAAQGNVIERARLLVTYTISSSGLARASPVTGARLMAEFDCWMPPEVH